jgi:hypothetical protein
MFRSKGYAVKLMGRAGLVYSEGSRSMHIDSELLSGGDFDVVIFLSSLKKWDAPLEAEPISETDLARIRANISEALSNLRIDWQYARSGVIRASTVAIGASSGVSHTSLSVSWIPYGG